MARLFDDANTEYLVNANAVVTNYPFTMSSWFRADDVTGQYVLMSLGDKDSATQRVFMFINGAEDDRLQLTIQNDATSYATWTTTAYTANAWYHACAYAPDNAVGNWRVFLNAAGGQDTGSEDTLNFISADRTGIGANVDSSVSGYMSGVIAEAAIWNVVLTAAEIAILAKGYSPLLVRPQSLVGYWPLIGRCSPEIDLVGGYGMTLTSGDSGPVVAAHPRVLMPTMPHFIYPPAAAGFMLLRPNKWGNKHAWALGGKQA